MRLRLAFARLAFFATLVGHALAQDGGGNNGNNGNAGGNGNGNAPQPSSSAPPAASASNSNSALAGNGNRTSAAASASSAPVNGDVVATTITSLVPGPSGSTQTAVFTFTFTVGRHNNTANGPNSTLTNGTVDTNSTHNETVGPWNDTLAYLPFSPKLDPAYGLGGALLILSGIPVATLGGKNRWSALAIVSGYTVALFCLIIILSFG